MMTAACGVRPTRERARRDAGASIREVCLMGVEGPPSPSCSVGDRMIVGGRAYQVAALDDEDGPLRYIHLR